MAWIGDRDKQPRTLVLASGCRCRAPEEQLEVATAIASMAALDTPRSSSHEVMDFTSGNYQAQPAQRGVRSGGPRDRREGWTGSTASLGRCGTARSDSVMADSSHITTCPFYRLSRARWALHRWFSVHVTLHLAGSACAWQQQGRTERAMQRGHAPLDCSCTFLRLLVSGGRAHSALSPSGRPCLAARLVQGGEVCGY